MIKHDTLSARQGIVVSKWVEDLWAFEERHPFVSGSSLTSKGWAPVPQRSKQKARKAQRKSGAGFATPVKVDAALAAVVGNKPTPRGQITKKVWDYIKKNNLQVSDKSTKINADAKLQAIFGGKKVVTSLEMITLVGKHIKA